MKALPFPFLNLFESSQLLLWSTEETEAQSWNNSPWLHRHQVVKLGWIQAGFTQKYRLHNASTGKYERYTTLPESPLTVTRHHLPSLLPSHTTLPPNLEWNQICSSPSVMAGALTGFSRSAYTWRGHLNRILSLSEATFWRPASLNWDSKPMTHCLALPGNPLCLLPCTHSPSSFTFIHNLPSALVQKADLNKVFPIIALITITATIFWAFIMQQAQQTRCHYILTPAQSRHCLQFIDDKTKAKR